MKGTFDIVCKKNSQGKHVEYPLKASEDACEFWAKEVDLSRTTDIH